MNRNSIEKLTKYAKKINTKIGELRREISKNPIIIPIEKPYLSGWKLTLKLDTYNLNPKLIKDYETVLDLFKNRRENEHFTRNPLLIRHIRKNNYDLKSLYNYSGKTKNREDYIIRNSSGSKSWRFRISKETYNNLTQKVQIYFNLIDDLKSKYTDYYLNYKFLDKHFKIKIEKYYKTEIKLSNPTLVSEKTQLDNKFRHLQLHKYLGYYNRYKYSYQTTIKRRSTLNSKLYKNYYNVDKELTDDNLLEIDNKSKINNYKKFGWSWK